jgi:hypothetical protein
MKRTAALTAIVITASAIPAPLAFGKTTEARFNHRANDICLAAGKKIEALPQSGTDTNPAKTMQSTVKIVNALAAKLSKVEAPAARKAKFKQYITLTRQGAAFMTQGIGQARAHHVDRSADFFYKAVKAGQKSVAVATDLDLTECARDRYPGLTGDAGTNG